MPQVILNLELNEILQAFSKFPITSSPFSA